MKKGISQPLIAITLGIIFIVIVLLVFTTPLKKYVNDMFTKGAFNATKASSYGKATEYDSRLNEVFEKNDYLTDSGEGS